MLTDIHGVHEAHTAGVGAAEGNEVNQILANLDSGAHAAPVDGTESAPFDVNSLFDVCCRDPAVARQALDSFERQSLADLAQLTNLSRRTDPLVSARLSHMMRGSAALLRADALDRVATEVEAAACSADVGRLARHIAELRLEVERCVNYVASARTALDRLGSSST